MLTIDMEYLLDYRYTYPSYLATIDKHDDYADARGLSETLKNDYFKKE